MYACEKRGFTLIEVLIVLGIIAILAAVVLVAINPGRQFAEARNTQRLSNVTTILNAIGQRIADGHGSFNGGGGPNCPSLVTGTDYDISSAAGAPSIDLSCLTPTYIPSALPVDPGANGATWTSAADYDTKYHIMVDAQGRYTVSAPSAELSQVISATR